MINKKYELVAERLQCKHKVATITCTSLNLTIECILKKQVFDNIQLHAIKAQGNTSNVETKKFNRI